MLIFRAFERICETYGEKFIKYAAYRQFLGDLEQDERLRDKKFGLAYFDLLENEISEDERKIIELIDSHSQINETLETLIEKKSVFDKSSQLILAGPDQSIQLNAAPIMQNDVEEGFRSGLNFIAGVIKAEDDLKMKRMIFRISRGRAIPTFFDLSTDIKYNVKK